MARIKGILFDLGNTLLDFGTVDTLGLFAEGARLAYSYLQGLGQPLPPFGRFHRRQLWAVRWRYLVSHVTGREFNSLDVLGQLSASMGHDLTPEQTEELAWLWYQPLSRCAEVEDGLEEMLARFRREGLRLGLVSNTFIPGQALDRHLESLGLLEYFRTRVYSCDVRYRKPHPEIFRIALARLPAAAVETIFVGDSVAADVAGALNAGMIAVLKDPSGAKHGRGVRRAYRIKSLRQLPEVVGYYNSASGEAGP